MKVSVVVVTYNHQNYIAECLDSIFRQKVTFDFEVIIGNDHSTDRTAEIIEEYAQKYENLTSYIPPEEKRVFIQGRPTGRYNIISAISRAKGEYIAQLDGDDFWSDMNKLQEQVDFLDSNQNCIACHTWHSYLRMENGNWVEKKAPTKTHGYSNEKFSDVQKILENKLRIKSRTVMFRNIVEIPEKFKEVPYGDIGFSILLGKYGEYGFIDEPMAVYRVHEDGLSSSNKDRKHRLVHDRFNLLESFYFAKEVFGNKYDIVLNKFFAEKMNEIALAKRRSWMAFREVNKRIDTLCEKYSMKKKDFKRIARKAWLKPVKKK
ncbi:glycosyltransferase family 2 protein [Parvicella tangerina]|uniref:Glycosyltransferase 2-like domain-containing protein n=1 Tax=Parvicella tangerina TaxID=2829795 RepID=A0A916JMN4_9FLAO|nr:glycosyltransferase family A protein [Parvicella tangerina]CAG5079714.1 hypothetical protein CRYO30217_01030 [Parvicella tangerina]